MKKHTQTTHHMAAAFPIDICRSLLRHRLSNAIKGKTPIARPSKTKINVKPVKPHEISLITPTVAIIPVMINIIISMYIQQNKTKQNKQNKQKKKNKKKKLIYM